jgi:hypothetical protein
VKTKPVMRTAGGVTADSARASRWLPDRPVTSTARWSPARARAWHEQQGWLVGCNFVPSTAGNQLEMFQAETFDPETIRRELSWAAELGFNSIRLFLHELLWRHDDRFLDRVEQVLELAHAVGIGAMPVLFDGVWNPRPRLGDQGNPRPGVHNSMWVQSPGAEALVDRSRWPQLREYVDAVLSRFGDDPRVQVWDLFNEPDNPNGFTYGSTELPDKRTAVTPLVDAVFDWAIEADPSQPLTVGIWVGVHGRPERVSRLNRISLARSDVLSFHSYRKRDPLRRAIAHLSGYDRPLLCTEWLARSAGSTVDLIDDFAELGVGAYCWGLVAGRSQTIHPWTSWVRPGRSEPDPWFHDLLRDDGTANDSDEVARLRRATGADGEAE